MSSDRGSPPRIGVLYCEYQDALRKFLRRADDSPMTVRTLDAMAQDAGVDVRFFTRVIDAEASNGRVEGAVISNVEGYRFIRAKAFIDCTPQPVDWLRDRIREAIAARQNPPATTPDRTPR